MYAPGDLIFFEFFCYDPDTRLAVNADALPSVYSSWMKHVGPTQVTGPTMVVAQGTGTTGRYLVVGAVPDEALYRDVITFRAAATIGGTAYAAPVGPTIVVEAAPDKTGYSLTADYDAAKTALTVDGYTEPPTAASIAAELDMIILNAGVIAASPAPTTTAFAVQGLGAQAYRGGLLLTVGTSQKVRCDIQSDVVTGNDHLFTLVSALVAAPIAGAVVQVW